jgi:hypothetical protein
MRERNRTYKVFVGKPEGRRSLGILDMDGKIILKWIFEKWDGAWTGSMWLRIETDGGLL